MMMCEAAFQNAIEAESSNTIGVAMLLLRLGNVQRDASEGLPDALDRAVESHRQSVKLFATALSMHHHATLRARHALSLSLLAKGDHQAATAELEAIL